MLILWNLEKGLFLIWTMRLSFSQLNVRVIAQFNASLVHSGCFATTNQTELFIIFSGSHDCGCRPGVGATVNDRLERVF